MRRKLSLLVTTVVVLLFREQRVAALYLPESKASQRLVRSTELCSDAETEFASWPQDEFPTTLKSLYNRSPSILGSGRLRSRLLDEGLEKKALLDSLQRIYARDIVASASTLQASLSNLGDLVLIKKVVSKLIAGQPLKVVALGGSITFGHGPVLKKNAYLNQIYEWLNQTFPHPDHQFLNHAIPAVTSAYVSPCILDLTPADADLVLIEFTFNDSERGSHKLEDDPILWTLAQTRSVIVNSTDLYSRRALERMLRKLLQLPSHPAILLVHYWAGRRQKDHFSDTAEDGINTILKYYRLMGISMRDALYQQYVEDETFLEGMYRPPSDGDEVHPSCIGSRYFADLIIGHFQDLAAAELLFPAGTSEVHRAEVGDRKMPARGFAPPLQANNWGNRTEACILEPQEVHKLVTKQNGFEWTDESRQKWGFVGTAPGSSMEVDVPVKGLAGDLTIGLGFLHSYQHMGMARLECMAGCNCRAREYSFHHPYGISINSWRILETLVPPNSASCKLNVTIVAGTHSMPPEHKVKLTSIMITQEKGFMMAWLFCDECLQ